MGVQIQPKAVASPQSKAGREFLEKLEFSHACFALSQLNGDLAAVGGEQFLNASHIVRALDDTVPVLEAVADRLEGQVRDVGAWNVEAAGRNEIILSDIERNWSLLEKLTSRLGDA
ncbi:MAG: hypothetical protein AB7O76_22495 [Rhizobiaceae bacterium]